MIAGGSPRNRSWSAFAALGLRPEPRPDLDAVRRWVAERTEQPETAEAS